MKRNWNKKSDNLTVYYAGIRAGTITMQKRYSIRGFTASGSFDRVFRSATAASKFLKTTAANICIVLKHPPHTVRTAGYIDGEPIFWQYVNPLRNKMAILEYQMALLANSSNVALKTMLEEGIDKLKKQIKREQLYHKSRRELYEV